jgi:hypothetical protein
MDTGEPESPTLCGYSAFDALVEYLRLDFRRVFPHLAAREARHFFVKREPGGESGKVWIKEERLVSGRRVLCTITLVIEGGRVARKFDQEVVTPANEDDTALEVPTLAAVPRRRGPA